MQEKIYTIPVNEAFEQTDECPFCVMYEKLEFNEIELITGASMMSPDVRIKTNKLGFCSDHIHKMYDKNLRLPLALTLQTHLAEIKNDISLGGFFSKDISAKPIKRIEELNETCYVCGRIEEQFSKMLNTACYLYDKEQEFRDKFNSQTRFCLPHYAMILKTCKTVVSKRWLEQFIKDSDKILNDYLTSLYDDISLFCKKFDYNYKDTPWGNAKDSVDRTIKFLCTMNK
ncbi:DUF6062 family protein [Eubacteriales bacterium OttesenSCG-928-G02]|nr:DUF6062 family protein [Eubacteriales bacterium OttesenSCG-928-G02]